MTARIVHRVLLHTRPDGTQQVACVCPFGIDHVATRVMIKGEGEGEWWIRLW